jgi:anhydro-N-acetylmuramic acid kinase
LSNVDDALYLGLISGTSADGIDAAIARFSPRLEVLYATTCAWQPSLREELLSLGQESTMLSLDQIGELDTRIGVAFAEAARRACLDAGIAQSTIAAIGSHGQTLRHRPHGDNPFTLQLGDPNIIAERSGITTVADFRRRDVAAGGNGAPLMPAFHARVLHSDRENRAVLNLGGIANLTLLPTQGTVLGFDTGPANGLMDAWCHRVHGASYDRDGEMASAGTVLKPLLATLLEDPWLALPAPKSTGRDYFHLSWLLPKLSGVESAVDVQATLLELTARSIRDALRASMPHCDRLIVCGGGARNSALMRRLADLHDGVIVESSAVSGLDPDFVEALGFAWLAREALAGRPGNLPSVTGARGRRVLGAIYAGGGQYA